jgi:hypothetical protein
LPQQILADVRIDVHGNRRLSSWISEGERRAAAELSRADDRAHVRSENLDGNIGGLWRISIARRRGRARRLNVIRQHVS